MDKTKSKLAQFFDNDDDESPFPQKAVDDQKLSQYTQGTVRKSRREKEREAAEAKKREEEENAAKAYAEFLDAFESEESNRKKQGSTFVKSGQEGVYVPSAPSAMRGRGESSRTASMFTQDHRPLSPPAAVPKPKGKRAMDSFLEEIKKEQALRENRLGRHATQGRSITSIAAYEGQSGSKDRGDPETSNVFVANLPPHVTEQSLGQFFARMGPVGSVKIMWPRGDGSIGPGADMTSSRRTKNSGLSGFVSFMKRRDAEAALRELDGFDWGGSVLRVGWSKAVPMAAKPMFVSNKTRSPTPSRSRSRSPKPHSKYSRSRSPEREKEGGKDRSYHHHTSRKSRSHSRDDRSYSRSRSPSRSHHRRSYSHDRSRRYDSRSRSPKRRRSHSREFDDDEITDQYIRIVAREVKGHGEEYEESLREREKSNPTYAFLKKNHRRYRFYRSLVDRKDDLEPEFDDEGYNSVYSTDSAEESERERVRKNELGKLAKKRFEAMLRALSGRRGELARCMAFSLEHAEAAGEVADIIVSSLLVDGTAVPRKVARLHLICDILHNSAAPLPMAWKFRQEFQARLGIVFDHLSTIYHSFPGRITAETFKKQITSIVDIWEDWIVFPPDFTAELRARLEGSTVQRDSAQVMDTTEEENLAEQSDTRSFQSKFKASSFKPAAAANEEPVGMGEAPMDEGSDVDGIPIDDDLDGAPIGDDVDGEPIIADIEEPIGADVDGEPIGDVDGEAMDDVDGEPMQAEDVDGEPMDDDIDGAPVDI
ncbi:hypothetical protein C8Q75DRAFT_775888 [Abortiporus biennis]|nr:hypothetical protein C8Q75DRAFT_775888 [Abortiporus biennis]